MTDENKKETLEDIALELLNEYAWKGQIIIYDNSVSVYEPMARLGKEVEEIRQRIEAASK